MVLQRWHDYAVIIITSTELLWMGFQHTVACLVLCVTYMVYMYFILLTLKVLSINECVVGKTVINKFLQEISLQLVNTDQHRTHGN